MDNRAVTPVVEKAITMGIVVLFVGGMTATLFGTAVPAYRDATGAEVGDRALAMATEEVEQAIPPDETNVRTVRTVDLPTTIRGSEYAVRVDGRSLVLDHRDLAVGGRSRLTLPPSVRQVSGEWKSGATNRVVVESVTGGLAVELQEASP